MLNNLGTDSRRPHMLPQVLMKAAISDDQAETLRTLEQVGWTLRFLRQQTQGEPLAVVYDPDRKALAVIEPDGQLVENPDLEFRAV